MISINLKESLAFKPDNNHRHTPQPSEMVFWFQLRMSQRRSKCLNQLEEIKCVASNNQVSIERVKMCLKKIVGHD